MKRFFTKAVFTSGTAVVIYLMAVNLIFHMVTGWQYGFFRDELYYFSMSNHLDYGYVDITPVVPWLMALSRLLMGNSIFAMHVFPALAGSFAMFFAALTARKMGGGRFAQGLTALVVMAAPMFMALFSMFIYDAFDQLMSAIVIFMVAKILKGEATWKTWILFGFLAGIGIMVKITMGFLILALILGLLLTRARKHFLNKWFWVSAAIAVACFIPYVVWQAVHAFPLLEYLRYYRNTRTVGVSVFELLLNIVVSMNPLAILLWLGGLVLLFTKRGRIFRPFAWAFIVYFTFAALTAVKFYALGGALLPLTAFGAVCLEKNYRKEPVLLPGTNDPMPRRPKRKLSLVPKIAYLLLLCLVGAMFAPLSVPILPVQELAVYNRALDISRLVRWETSISSGIPALLADRLGWEEMARVVSGVYHSLPESEQKDCRVLCVNYGEAGAIDYYSEKYGIPQSISGHLSHFYWGYDGYEGKCLIIVGLGNVIVSQLKDLFDDVQAIKGPHTDYATPYENDVPIYLCKGLKIPVEEFWKGIRSVG